MDILIDHNAASATLNRIDEARQARFDQWNQIKAEFDELQSARKIVGAAAQACQLAVDRVNDEMIRQNQSEVALIEHIQSALADDQRTEEDSASLFTGLGA